MELASYLAGERWSDHPACTHPLLAAVARLVNDYTSDAARAQLAPLIPSVIGLTSDDPRLDVRIALRAATIALPVVSAERQRTMAAAILAAERSLAELDGRPLGELEERSRRALTQAPHAARWAAEFTRRMRVNGKRFRRRAAPSVVRVAADGLAQACVPDPDRWLRELLVGAIDECETFAAHDRDAALDGGVDQAAWAAACELTSAGR